MLTSNDNGMMNKSREGETIPIRMMNRISRPNAIYRETLFFPSDITQKKFISSIIFAPLIPHEMLNRHIRCS